MNIVNETITPAKAHQYLLTSKGNRPISKPTVLSYADSMKQGKWMLNGVCIIFDMDGHLIDGHHRLHAIELAQIPVEMTVCRGVDSKAFTTYDCGLHRKLGQLLAMQDVKNYNAVGAVVLANDSLVKTGRIYANNSVEIGRRGKKTNTDNYALYCSDPNGFQHAASFALNLYRTANFISASWIGGLFYFLTHTGCYGSNVVETFFTNLCSLDGSDIAPIEMLRKRLIKERVAGRKIKPDILFALICKTWNYYITLDFKKRVSYDPDKEKEYPKLKLNPQ